MSTDRDYFTEHKETLYLNSLLIQDVYANNKNINIKLFNKLSEALRDYNKQIQIHSLPNNEELNKISEVEEAGLKITNYYTDEGKPIRPKSCAACGSIDSFSNGSYLRSRHGGLTLQYICKMCGYIIDTGESFD